MTTIAYQGGIMAADSRAYSGNKVWIGSKVKLHRMSNGALVGSTSRLVGKTELFAAWIQEQIDSKVASPGEMLSEQPIGVAGLLVWPDGSVWYWNDGSNFAGPLEADYFAVGSGEEFAQGAMAMGASAEQAVEAACLLDPWSAPPIVTMKLEAPSPRRRRKR